jgi:hypothetical protein
VAGVDVHVVGRILLQQGLLALAELVRVLVDVLAVNAQNGLFILEGSAQKPLFGLKSAGALVRPPV